MIESAALMKQMLINANVRMKVVHLLSELGADDAMLLLNSLIQEMQPMVSRKEEPRCIGVTPVRKRPKKKGKKHPLVEQKIKPRLSEVVAKVKSDAKSNTKIQKILHFIEQQALCNTQQIMDHMQVKNRKERHCIGVTMQVLRRRGQIIRDPKTSMWIFMKN